MPEVPVQPAVYPQIVQEFNPYPEAVAPPTAAPKKTAVPRPVAVQQGKKPASVRPVAHGGRQGGQQNAGRGKGNQGGSGKKKG